VRPPSTFGGKETGTDEVGALAVAAAILRRERPTFADVLGDLGFGQLDAHPTFAEKAPVGSSGLSTIRGCTLTKYLGLA
jgi:hypothetical protein